MGLHIEWLNIADCFVSIERAGAVIGEHVLDEQVAVVFVGSDAVVIEGSVDELQARFEQVVTALREQKTAGAAEALDRPRP